MSHLYIEGLASAAPREEERENFLNMTTFVRVSRPLWWLDGVGEMAKAVIQMVGRTCERQGQQ
jgi:hypothetical protein